MQPPRMLPLLISMLAMPISLPMPVLVGPSAIVVIIIFVLAMLSPVQAIISAEAGVNAKAENMAAVIKIFFIGTSLENETSVLLAIEIRFSSGCVSSTKTLLCAAMQWKRLRQAVFSPRAPSMNREPGAAQ